MRRPWMPLFIGDFIADTMHLGATETGIYIRLLIHCWKHDGRIPRDPRQLAMIAHCDSRLWRQYAPTVMAFFQVVDDASMENERLSTELRRCGEISNKRKAAALQKHSKSRAKQKGDRRSTVEGSTAQRLNDVLPNDFNAEILQKHTQSHTHTEREEEKNARAPSSLDFEKFWNAYPNQVGRTVAEEAFEAALKVVQVDALMVGLKRYVDTKPADRQWCNPATWLNQQRWLDPPALPLARGPPNGGNGHQSLKDQRRQEHEDVRRAVRDSIERDERKARMGETDGLLPAIKRI